MVSIIIPVYNVENYIDRCLESVVMQTYQNIEILVMEAKSTDSSLEKVLGWAKNDDRFTVVSRRDGGLGPARNYALKLAKGEYIIFLDSDDWLDTDYVEKMLKVAQQQAEIDLVLSGFYKHMDGSETYTECLNPWIEGIYDGADFKKQVICYGNNSMWGRLIRRCVFEKYQIEQPALPFEDLAVHPAITIAARKIGICTDAFVHYQAERQGSLLGNKNSYYKLQEVFAWERQEFAKVDTTRLYNDVRKYFAFRHWLAIYKNTFGKEANPEELKKYFGDFPKQMKKNYVIYGGFPSRWTVHRMYKGKDNLRFHCIFTNMISQMSKPVELSEIHHENLFRDAAIQNDFQKSFVDIVKKDNEDTYYIVDLLEECQSVFRVGDDQYVTQSEALLETTFNIKEGYEKISWDCAEFWELWKHYCDLWKKLFVYKQERIIVMEYYYSEKYIKDSKYIFYENIENIRQKNRMLKKMYEYFSIDMQKVRYYTVPDKLRYTDVEKQKLDVSPRYMNAFAYNEMSQKLELDVLEMRLC